jgi:hypothetical protein
MAKIPGFECGAREVTGKSESALELDRPAASITQVSEDDLPFEAIDAIEQA